MAKMQHETPPGFIRVKTPGEERVTYKAGLTAFAHHARFLRQVRDKKIFGIEPGIEVAKHVKLGHRNFFSTDLVSAFDQVTFERLRRALAFRSINPGWLSPLPYFFHERGRGGLIQGSQSSSYLFETYLKFGGLDRDLAEYCDKLGYHYSRYVDDILISAKREIGKRLGPMVRKIVGRYGFALNDGKTKRVNVNYDSLAVLGYLIRGSRIDIDPATAQKFFDPDISDASRRGLHAWHRRIRDIHNRAR